MLDLLPPYLFGTMREHYLLLFGSAGLVGLLFGMVGAWFGARAGARRGAHRGLRESGNLIDVELRRQVAELAQAVDVVAVEVERVSEAQRYTARLLALRARADLARLGDRTPADAPLAITPSDLPRAARHVTPH